MKLTRKKLRNLILKEYLNTAGNSGYRFRGGGFGLPPDEPDDGWLIDPDYDYLNDPNFQQVTCGLSFCIDADGNVIE